MKKKLIELIEYETKAYNEFGNGGLLSSFYGWLKNDTIYRIKRWQYYSRLTDYYWVKQNSSKNLWYKLCYLYYIRKRNNKAENLGLEMSTQNIGKGLLLYHAGATVVNGKAIIGENCKFHGNICIGNAGPHDRRAPIIGNNVEIGAGSKIIGAIEIADNIIIGAGSVVVHSFLEPGITIAGVPAKKIIK